jgi:hypothetical protein
MLLLLGRECLCVCCFPMYSRALSWNYILQPIDTGCLAIRGLIWRSQVSHGLFQH